MNPKPEALWSELSDAGLVEGAMPVSDVAPAPWYVRIMLGVSGWLAAVFLFGFIVTGMEFIIESETLSITLGTLGLGIAFVLFRIARNDFLEQFALAMSFAAQALLFFGLAEWVGWRDSRIWWIAALLQTIIAALMPNFVQRLVAGYLAVHALSTAMTLHGAPYITSALATLAIVPIWLNELGWRRWGQVLRPLGYGLTLALVQLEGHTLFGHTLGLFYTRQAELQFFIPPWVGELITGLLLLTVVGRLCTRSGLLWSDRRLIIAILMTALTVGFSLEAPGVATGLTIILLGFSNTNRILVALGIISLLFYLSAYYYTLETTLLAKSALLAATGTSLLIARWVARKWIFPHGDASHA